MDEQKHRCPLRRIALVAVISCSATVGRSQQPANEPAQSFRNLIAKGWRAETAVDVITFPSKVEPIPTLISVSELSRSDESISPTEMDPILVTAPEAGRPEDESTIDPHPPAVAANEHPQAICLQESARQSLRYAHQRMRRGATHSAKMYASETLQTIVAMQDVRCGGNGNAKHLCDALDAIRESRDFGTRFGLIDNEAIQRLVAVHETNCLKGHDLENLSATAATRAYLTFAEQQLIAAAGGQIEASAALVILGTVERETSDPSNAHSLAIAATMHRAAVQIAPENMLAHRALGATLHRQGLLDQAAASLNESLRIAPTRAGYERLLEVSNRRGDLATAEACTAALRDEDLPNEFPVLNMSPDQFAATHRPSQGSVPNGNSGKTNAHQQGQSPTTEPTRISLFSKLKFGKK